MGIIYALPSRHLPGSSPHDLNPARILHKTTPDPSIHIANVKLFDIGQVKPSFDLGRERFSVFLLLTRQENLFRAQRVFDVFQKHLHGTNVCDMVFVTPGKDVTTDAALLIVDDPSARITANCNSC